MTLGKISDKDIRHYHFLKSTCDIGDPPSRAPFVFRECGERPVYDNFKGRGEKITANIEKKLILFRYPSSLCVIPPYLRHRDPLISKKPIPLFIFLSKLRMTHLLHLHQSVIPRLYYPTHYLMTFNCKCNCTRTWIIRKYVQSIFP